MGRRRVAVLVYRVFPYLLSATLGEPGHPLYEHHPQRAGRIDHPDYYVWYLAAQPEAAAGEVFGDLAQWDDSMFAFPALHGARRALGVYRLPDDLRLLNLDDPAELMHRSLRPTQVVSRNLGVTQAWGHDVWDERDPHAPAEHRWQAVQWWSFHRPTWDIIASWLQPQLEHIEALDLTHSAVRDAAAALMRPLP